MTDALPGGHRQGGKEQEGGQLSMGNTSKVVWQDHACDFRGLVRSSTDGLTEV